MNVYLRLKDNSDWSVTIRVDLSFQGYGNGNWKVFDSGNAPWSYLCLKPCGWFDYDASTQCTTFQCVGPNGSWENCFFICDAPSNSWDTKHTSSDGVVTYPANPIGNCLYLEWYRLDQMF